MSLTLQGDPAVIHPPSLRPAVATKTTARTRTTSNDPRPEKRRRAMGDGSQPGLAAETLSRKNLRKDRKLKKKYPMVKGGDTYCLPGQLLWSRVFPRIHTLMTRQANGNQCQRFATQSTSSLRRPTLIRGTKRLA